MKIRIAILFSILIIMNGCANSETLTGYWAGSMEMNGKSVDMSIHLNQDKNMFSSYDLMLLDQPITDLKLTNEKITFSVNLDVEFVFNGEFKKEQIIGNTKINGGPPNMNIAFNLTKQLKAPVKPYSIENLIIKSNDIILSTEIYTPKTEGLNPAIVLLQGSSTNLKTDYIFYADYFAKLGFEVLIFDKRGCGESTGNYYTSSYEDLITDVIACLEELDSRESIDKSKIGLWGFSQGAMLLPKIVSETDIPKFIIAKSPEVTSVTAAAAFSDSLRIVNSGYSELDGQVVAKSHRMVEKMIREGKSCAEVEEYIHQNAQKYSFMNLTGLYGDIEIEENEYSGFYWKGRTENFISYWENLSISTLVLFGARDSFVNAIGSEVILQKLGSSNIEIEMFPFANHNLKKVFDPTTDREFDWPRIIEGYNDCVEKWIFELDK